MTTIKLFFRKQAELKIEQVSEYPHYQQNK